MLTLHNDRLNVSIEEPGEDYRGSRYDWSSFITQVTLDGQYQFLGVESLDPDKGCGGKGLCGELSMMAALAYDDVSCWQQFIKPGVGLLTRTHNGDYGFADEYPVEPAQWQAVRDHGSIRFSTTQALLHGYAFVYDKCLSLHENQLRIDYRLTNAGSRDIRTHEYCHNYIQFADFSTDHHYQVELNFSPELKINDPHLVWQQPRLGFDGAIESAFFCQDLHACVGTRNASWTMTNQGYSVQETLDQPIMKFAFYGTPHAVCPELFVDINAPVGQTFSWQRVWTFSKE